MTATLDSALVTANRALARQGRSFHWARTFLSPQHASRATRLYGFCRRLDDLADDGAANSQPQKAFGEIRIALATGQSNDAGICDGIRLFRECSIAPEIPNALLDGLISDLAGDFIAERGELVEARRHCGREDAQDGRGHWISPCIQHGPMRMAVGMSSLTARITGWCWAS